MQETKTRISGILMPVFSLPNKYGIGDFGEDCFKFIDFLKAAGQKAWQILPLVETGFSNSPYSSVSSASFEPLYISPENLYKEGLIDKSDLTFSESDSKYVDYRYIRSIRTPLLRKAFSKFDRESKEFKAFVKSGRGEEYALFTALKEKYGGKSFTLWGKEYLKRDKKAIDTFKKENEEEYLFRLFLYFKAESEWLAVKKYANENGISIIGDLPLYVAEDSADVWAHPELFKLDENYKPRKKAGVPPDYFSADGQLWGNPVYDYDAHRKDGFSWWVNRLKRALSIFDYVRIDHFRGLSAYYEIDKDSDSAKNGEWKKVPSDELFSAVKSSLDDSKIIAEDLGIIDDGVKDLLKKTGYPGMKVLSFAFNGEKNNPYLPENLPYNSVCYTGTHDNDTLKGLLDKFSDWDRNNFINGERESLSKLSLTPVDPITDTIRLGLRSESKMFIMPIQDFLGLGTEYRINEPGTVKDENWSVRLEKAHFSGEVAKKLKKLTEEFGR